MVMFKFTTLLDTFLNLQSFIDNEAVPSDQNSVYHQLTFKFEVNLTSVHGLSNIEGNNSQASIMKSVNMNL
jgi:hypothetical protein